MEFALLMKVTAFLNAVVKAGYVLAGSYFVRTGWQYVKDYRYFSQQEKSD